MSADSCLVHGSEHASKFQTTLTKLRRIHEFSEIIYRQLAQHCCSCYGATNCTSIDLDALRKMCLNLASKPPKKIDEDDEDLKPIHWKKNKKKQLMKSDRQSDLREQLNEYEDDEEYGTDDDSLDGRSGPSPPYGRYMPPHRAALMKEKGAKAHAKALASSRKTNACKAFLAFFKPIPVPEPCCLVHDKKYRSQFNHIFNQLRTVSNYSQQVYNEFPRHCCSCKGERRITSIDPELFCQHLKEIQSRLATAKKDEPDGTFDRVILLYESELNDSTRRAKIGQFIGKDGRHLVAWQNQYNIRIHIIDQSSKEKIKERSDLIGSVTDTTGVVLTFGKRNKMIEDPLKTDEIRATMLEAWKAAKETCSGRRNRPVRRAVLQKNRFRGRKRY